MAAEDTAKHEEYVDELVGSADYWLTITDAARATRRQDITIRRWIATGQLPVRRHAVGLNQRTRQVRASDLARLTPIIDPTAVITGEEGRLNLMSIPVEQAQIKAGQQEMQLQLATLREHVEQQGQAFRQALAEHRLAFLQHQEQLREALATQFSQVQEALLGTRTALEAMRTEQQQRLEHLRTVLAGQVAHRDDSFQRFCQESTTVLAQHTQELERLHQRLDIQGTEYQKALRSSQDEMNTRFAQQRSANEQAMQAFDEWMAAELAKLMERLETLTTQVTVNTQSLDHTQQRVQEHEQQVERLVETTAHLTEQLARYEQAQQRLLSLIEHPPTSGQNEG